MKEHIRKSSANIRIIIKYSFCHVKLNMRAKWNPRHKAGLINRAWGRR